MFQVPNVSEWKTLSKSLSPGGENVPDAEAISIIVPYRDRGDHLHVFLGHIHPFLMMQNIHYRIYIVNQADSNEFNRAALMNVGFKESLKDFNWACFIFHDVDHLPEDTRNLYSCSDQPRHMVVAVDRWKYKLIYPVYFGGVVALRRDYFEAING